MQQSYRAIELALRPPVTRSGELHFSKRLPIPMLMLLRHSLRCEERRQDSRDNPLPAQWRLRSELIQVDVAK